MGIGNQAADSSLRSMYFVSQNVRETLSTLRAGRKSSVVIGYPCSRGCAEGRWGKQDIGYLETFSENNNTESVGGQNHEPNSVDRSKSGYRPAMASIDSTGSVSPVAKPCLMTPDINRKLSVREDEISLRRGGAAKPDPKSVL